MLRGVVGNLNAELDACEAQHKVAFELANEKSMENVQLGSNLTAARSKVAELELRVQALEEQATRQREELELGKKKIAELSVNVAVHGVTDAITFMLSCYGALTGLNCQRPSGKL